MADIIQLAKVLKSSAVSAVESNKPVTVTFGKVISIAPLRIEVDQKLVLSENQLIVPERFIDRTIEVVPNFSESAFPKLSPNLNQPQKPVIRNSLQMGDKVILLRMQGGQMYLVIDRIVL